MNMGSLGIVLVRSKVYCGYVDFMFCYLFMRVEGAMTLLFR
jgi:hypothetical protein